MLEELRELHRISIDAYTNLTVAREKDGAEVVSAFKSAFSSLPEVGKVDVSLDSPWFFEWTFREHRVFTCRHSPGTAVPKTTFSGQTSFK